LVATINSMNFGMWDHPSSMKELARLIPSGVLGLYNCAEVTEIVAFRQDQPPANVFTIVVAEERIDDLNVPMRFLNSDRIRVGGLRGWTFGIVQYRIAIGDLPTLLDACNEQKNWSGSGNPLSVGPLAALPPAFIPPDSMRHVPLNGVLKNNFWNGSHILEWADTTKATFAPFFDDTTLLQELSDQVQPYVPITLAALSDRLGNIIVQLPVHVLLARFAGVRATAGIAVEMDWHPKATARPARASVESRRDGTVVACGSSPLKAGRTPLPVTLPRGSFQGVVWDDVHAIILAATGESAFINTIGITSQISSPEPRVFTIPVAGGTPNPQRIGVMSHGMTNYVGDGPQNVPSWPDRRIFRDELSALKAQKRFVQYRPDVTNPATERNQALEDIRYLIRHHGEDAAWLWDPYLSGKDLLETLFFCSRSGSDLRGLTAAETIDGTPRPDFVTSERAVLEAHKGNCHGLRLEYRAKIGPSGWRFHDRFLIFPRTKQGAKAWSLGTSVNSLGTTHHILQDVSDGELVMHAFLELWDQLNGPEHLIWKTP
jgi:hypothetical protein